MSFVSYVQVLKLASSTCWSSGALSLIDNAESREGEAMSCGLGAN